MLATKLDFPPEKAVQKKLFAKAEYCSQKGINEPNQGEKASNNTNKHLQNLFQYWKPKERFEASICAETISPASQVEPVEFCE